MKKALAVLMAITMVLLLAAACGSDSPSDSGGGGGTDGGTSTNGGSSGGGDDSGSGGGSDGGGGDDGGSAIGEGHQFADENYTLKIVVTAWEHQRDAGAVFAAMGDRLTEMGFPGLNVEVIGFSWSDFDGGAMNAFVMGGQPYDLLWAPDWVTFWAELRDGDGFQPWDPYLQQVPAYYDMIAPYHDYMIVPGGSDSREAVWRVPTFKEFGGVQLAIRFNKTVTDQLGITDQVRNVTSVYELEPFMEMFIERWPGHSAAIGGNALMDYFQKNDNNNPFQPTWNSRTNSYTIGAYEPWFREYTDMTRDWRARGFIPDYQLTEEYANLFTMYGAESFLFSFNTGKPGGEAELNMRGDPFEWGEVMISTPIFSVGSMLGNPYAISAHSERPDLATFIYQLICTDWELNNLLLFGIEGAHYNLTANGLQRVEGSGYAPGVLAFIGNRLLCHPLYGEPADVMDQYQEFNENAIRLGNFGAPGPSDEFFEDYNADAFWGVHGALWDQYGNRMNMGWVGPDEIADIQSQLNAVGAQTFVDIYNEHFQWWSAQN